uniref:Uncharacterized protein n=1 Tax=Setaria viridis TaxID=4556 RepID=A0A4U6T2N5_SETVI|nr:hypothetical protein SEVIR_9G273600v2 [Setaria viridis]
MGVAEVSQPETAHHMLVDYRYSRRIWSMVASLISYNQVNPNQWAHTSTVKEWSTHMGAMPGVPRKGLRSLLLLVCWQLWLERNARTFQRTERHAHALLSQIRDEVCTWESAGAKHMAALLEGV